MKQICWLMIIITSVWIRASAEPETEENWGTCTAANGDQGICQDTSTCQGISTRFLCPGPSNIQCCTITNHSANSPSCGDNCPRGNCLNGCPCGTEESLFDMGALCASFDGWNQENCKCILLHESGGNANAAQQNGEGESATVDVGAFQINSIHWPSCNNGEPPCGLEGNLACAKTVFLNAHSTWRPWSACSFCGCDTA